MEISPRDKRAIVLTILVGGSILLYHYGLAPWFDQWDEVKQSIERESKKVSSLNVASPKALVARAHLNQKIPSFEKPAAENLQRHFMQKKFSDQLKRQGIKAQRMSYLSSTKKKHGYKMLKLQTKFICPMSKFYQLLASLNENAYFAGIEDLQMQVDKRNRSNVEVTMTLSTFAI